MNGITKEAAPCDLPSAAFPRRPRRDAGFPAGREAAALSDRHGAPDPELPWRGSRLRPDREPDHPPNLRALAADASAAPWSSPAEPGLEAPPGADRLSVTVSGVSVEGGLPEMAAATAALEGAAGRQARSGLGDLRRGAGARGGLCEGRATCSPAW